MTQLQLGMALPGSVAMAPQRLEPVIWVRRLRLVRELRPEPEHIIREVELRRGLNIVWAPPQAEHATGLFGAGITGHTAGKTSFCRLIRYALGERHFANEETRQSIRARLPSAWLLAEVVVDGCCWAVARPLGHVGKSFCIPNAGVADLPSGERSGDLTPYLDAIAAATTARLPATRFPGSDAGITWDHLLPWLTRDQECRFADFAVWRHPSSASEAPQLSSEERHFIMRSALGLVSDAEREEQHRNATLVARKKKLTDRLPLLSHQAQVDERRLAEVVGQTDVVASGLAADRLRGDLFRRRNILEQRRRELLANDPREEGRTVRERAAVEAENTARDLRDVEERLAGAQIDLDTLTSEHEGEQQRHLLSELKPSGDYCRVPLAMARREGCPLYSPRSIDFLAARGERSLEEIRAATERLVAFLESERREKKVALEAATERHAEAARRLIRVQTEFDRELMRLGEQDFRVREEERLLASAAESRHEADQAEQEIRRLAEEVTRSYDLQAAHRERQSAEYARLSTAFETTIRALLGDDMQAHVESAGRSLELQVVRDGRRDSAAITTVKLLAFDLAALVTSVSGQGEFPRILVHDGPREADLAPDVYERLFLYVRELEKRFADEPGFQYVVTTTTEPPAAVATEPWVRLRLSGIRTEDRLYRMDF
jgi:hypothetical protein